MVQTLSDSSIDKEGEILWLVQKEHLLRQNKNRYGNAWAIIGSYI